MPDLSPHGLRPRQPGLLVLEERTELRVTSDGVDLLLELLQKRSDLLQPRMDLVGGVSLFSKHVEGIREIASLETERGGLAHQLERIEEYPASRDAGGSGRADRDDDASRGR